MKNKFGWDKKDFESCLEKVSYPNKIKSNNYLQEGRFPIVSQDENLVCGFWDDESDVLKIQDSVVVFGDHTRALKYVDFDFVVGADGVRVLLPKSFMKSKFLYYYLKWVNVPSLGYSRHYKLLKELNLPVPPLPTQHQIVSELDALSEIISKKKLQLEELDKLAQATFYDMFGDPVTNEKGLTVKSLGEICEITSSKRIYAEEYQQDGIPFYRSKEIIEKGKKKPISLELYISYERYNEIKNKFGVPEIGDILMTAVGTIGEIWVVDTDSPFYFKDGNIVWLKMNKSNNSIYFLFVLGLLVKEYKAKMANGAAYSALTIVNLKNMEVVFPELDIQNEFATKIESIESQKSLITQSIAEVQQLFDYTMDKYFN